MTICVHISPCGHCNGHHTRWTCKHLDEVMGHESEWQKAEQHDELDACIQCGGSE